MRAFVLGIICVVICGFCFGVCVSSNAQDVIKIGSPFPLTGALGNVGLSAERGVRYAAYEINNDGGILGKKVEVIVRDDTGKADMTMRLARDMIAKDKVNFLVGSYGSATGLALSQIGKEKKILTMVNAKADKMFVEGFHRYGFSILTSTRSEGGQAATIAAEKLLKNTKTPKIYYLGYDYEYGHAIWNSFRAKIKEIRPDAELVGEAWVKIGETDYTAVITAMLAKKPDMIINSIWAGGIMGFFKQAKPYGLFEKTKFLCTAEGVAIDYCKALGEDMPEGIWGDAFDIFYWPADNACHKKYIQGMKKMYNMDDPGNYALPVYMAMRFLKAAIEKAGTIETEAVVNAMEQVKIDSPFFDGKIYFRQCDHQSNHGTVWGVTKKSAKYDHLILGEIMHVSADKGWYSCEETERLRSGK